jgi:hypothetical protein
MIDWPEVLKIGGALLGAALGFWNLLAPRWTGVKVDKRPSGIRITNTGARPVYVEFIGFIFADDWKPERAQLELRTTQDKAPPYTVEPWRSIDVAIDLTSEIGVRFRRPGVATYWMVQMENDVFFTTIPWHRVYAHWRARKETRFARREDAFMSQ